MISGKYEDLKEDDMHTIYNEVIEKISEQMPDALAYLFDPRDDQTHLEAIVIAEEFTEKTSLERHRLVMNALTASFSSGLHALALKTFTPKEWDEKKEQFNIGNSVCISTMKS